MFGLGLRAYESLPASADATAAGALYWWRNKDPAGKDYSRAKDTIQADDKVEAEFGAVLDALIGACEAAQPNCPLLTPDSFPDAEKLPPKQPSSRELSTATGEDTLDGCGARAKRRCLCSEGYAGGRHPPAEERPQGLRSPAPVNDAAVADSDSECVSDSELSTALEESAYNGIIPQGGGPTQRAVQGVLDSLISRCEQESAKAEDRTPAAEPPPQFAKLLASLLATPGRETPTAVDPNPPLVPASDWAAGGAWYVVVPLVEPAAAAAEAVDGAQVEAALDAGAGAALDWSQLEAYEQGYRVGRPSLMD